MLAEQPRRERPDPAARAERQARERHLRHRARLRAPATARSQANGAQRLGAFPQSTIALNDSTPELATARPYAVDLTGWFEGYTHPGTIDANGGASRIAPVVGVGSVENGSLNLLPSFLQPVLRQVLAFGGSGTGTGTGTNTSSSGLLTSGQGDRCPGSMERGSVFYPETGFPCDPSEVPSGN